MVLYLLPIQSKSSSGRETCAPDRHDVEISSYTKSYSGSFLFYRRSLSIPCFTCLRYRFPTLYSTSTASYDAKGLEGYLINHHDVCRVEGASSPQIKNAAKSKREKMHLMDIL